MYSIIELHVKQVKVTRYKMWDIFYNYFIFYISEFDITFSKTGDSLEFFKPIANESKQLALFTWIKMSNATRAITLLNENSSSLSIAYGTNIVFNITG